MAGDPTSSTHPPLPPTTEDDRIDWLRLLRSRRVGVSTFWRLLSEHGSARAALDALPGVARAAGVTDYAACPEPVARKELRRAEASGVLPVFFGSPAYPEMLTGLDDAPPILWCLGRPELLSRPAIAIVGSRTASSLATRMARRLARDLSDAGFIVVSGLARGVDAMAHRAALDGGTIAVMAGGTDVIYPLENADLAHDIARSGLRVSEQPIGLQPLARHFPARNRLISGMARAVVVVEAEAKSGSLITARNAADQGRDVLAVPGHPFESRAAGCNMLIRDGATLVRSAEDILEITGPAHPPADEPAIRNLFAPDGASTEPAPKPAPAAPPASDLEAAGALHARILERIGPGPVTEDQLIRDVAAPSHEVSPVLIELEMDGQIRRDPGGLVSRPA